MEQTQHKNHVVCSDLPSSVNPVNATWFHYLFCVFFRLKKKLNYGEMIGGELTTTVSNPEIFFEATML